MPSTLAILPLMLIKCYPKKLVGNMIKVSTLEIEEIYSSCLVSVVFSSTTSI